MQRLLPRLSMLLLLTALAIAAPLAAQPAVSIVASGLNNPRGLRVGPDGALYVAEGGTGGALSTVGQCAQVVPPVGPYTGDFTARIVKIDRHGELTVVADHLPSSQTSVNLGNLVSGVADVQFVHGRLFALLAGAGCSHGLADTTNGVIRIRANGSWELVADLSAFQKASPVANPEPDDFEPDGTWYSMTSIGKDIFALEPNHGELDRVSGRGRITRVADISASQGHIVPSSLAYHDGFFYVGNLSTFPIAPGSSSIYRINRGSGAVSVFATGFSTVLGLAADRRGRLYVLESMTAPGFPGPNEVGTGIIERIDRDGARVGIASGLSFPSAITLGPDGALYVSNWGFGGPPGMGEIWRVDVGSGRDGR